MATPLNPDLPDPKTIGKEYRKTATIFAVRMNHDFEVETLEGRHTAHQGDWLVKANTDCGELWPIADSVFQNTYVSVDQDALPKILEVKAKVDEEVSRARTALIIFGFIAGITIGGIVGFVLGQIL